MYMMIMPYSLVIVVLCCVRLLFTYLCRMYFNIWSVLKSELPHVIKAEGVVEVGRLLTDKSQQQALIFYGCVKPGS